MPKIAQAEIARRSGADSDKQEKRTFIREYLWNSIIRPRMVAIPCC
jgi:hypothetical protein